METQSASKVEACGKCRYWEIKESATGECHRYSPQTVAFSVDDETHFTTVFPETTAEEWCGEFFPRAID